VTKQGRAAERSDPDPSGRRDGLRRAIAEIIRLYAQIPHSSAARRSDSDCEAAIALAMALRVMKWIERGHDPRLHFGIEKRRGPLPLSDLSRAEIKTPVLRCAALLFAKLRQKEPGKPKKTHHSVAAQESDLPVSDVRQAIRDFGDSADIEARKTRMASIRKRLRRALIVYHILLEADARERMG
jgi:hypothetical protein